MGTVNPAASTPAVAQERLPQRALRIAGAVIERIPRRLFSRTNQAVIDGLISCISIFTAFLLRFDGAPPIKSQPAMFASLLLILLLRPGFIWALRGYDSTWRFFQMRDAMRLALQALPTTAVLLTLRLTLADDEWAAAVPITVAMMDYFLFLALAIGFRTFRRTAWEASRNTNQRSRALLLGTEANLPSAIHQVRVYPGVDVVGLLTPDEHLKGLRIGGLPVLGDPESLPKLLATRSADMVLIADASLDCLGATVSTAAEFGVDVSLLPSAENIFRGDVRVHATPKPEALMDRAVAHTAPHPAVEDAFSTRTVMITGAGGSIGSEIARQAAALPAARIVLFDQDENSIFEINNQLIATETRAELIPVVGDIRDRARLRSVFERYQPDVVLHAAAYKHVPVMEQNCAEAVLNNALGTRNVLDFSIEYGAERMVMISTDKAVKPSSIMGATKRVAELLVQARAASDTALKTRLACVRFGNVVGSRGSVVPIFLRQIAEGGPITITDEQMTRYFMTIPEAVQLVLQAATLASRGDVYMLDMGDPVKITALARKLIEMSGLRPDKDIEIRFTGARPGEKVHEQLWSEGAVVTPTEFPRVFAVQPDAAWEGFDESFEALTAAATARDEALVRARLEKMNIGYRRPQRAAAAHA